MKQRINKKIRAAIEIHNGSGNIKKCWVMKDLKKLKMIELKQICEDEGLIHGKLKKKELLLHIWENIKDDFDAYMPANNENRTTPKRLCLLSAQLRNLSKYDLGLLFKRFHFTHYSSHKKVDQVDFLVKHVYKYMLRFAPKTGVPTPYFIKTLVHKQKNDKLFMKINIKNAAKTLKLNVNKYKTYRTHLQDDTLQNHAKLAISGECMVQPTRAVLPLSIRSNRSNRNRSKKVIKKPKDLRSLIAKRAEKGKDRNRRSTFSRRVRKRRSKKQPQPQHSPEEIVPSPIMNLQLRTPTPTPSPSPAPKSHQKKIIDNSAKINNLTRTYNNGKFRDLTEQSLVLEQLWSAWRRRLQLVENTVEIEEANAELKKLDGAIYEIQEDIKDNIKIEQNEKKINKLQAKYNKIKKDDSQQKISTMKQILLAWKERADVVYEEKDEEETDNKIKEIIVKIKKLQGDLKKKKKNKTNKKKNKTNKKKNKTNKKKKKTNKKKKKTNKKKKKNTRKKLPLIFGHNVRSEGVKEMIMTLRDHKKKKQAKARSNYESDSDYEPTAYKKKGKKKK